MADEESRFILQRQAVMNVPGVACAWRTYRCFIYLQCTNDLPVILSSHIEFALQLDENEALGPELG